MAGTVVQVAQLAMTFPEKILPEILQAMRYSRKIAIGIVNETSATWEAINVYFDSGTSDVVIPEIVKPNEALLYNARKTRVPAPTGSVGVIAYYMRDVDKTLAVLFHVPFDKNLFDNCWDAKVYPGWNRANQDMYYDLYYGNPLKGDNGWYSKVIGEGYKVKGIMGSSGTCTQLLRIFQ